MGGSRATVLGVVSLAACAAPAPNVDEVPFTAIHRHYAEVGGRDEFASWRLEESDSEYAHRFRELSRERGELREFVFHGVYEPGHPKAAGALQIDETILARPFEATPFPEWNVEKMVELARVQRLALRDLAEVRWFLHADASSLVEVRTTASPARYAFHHASSGDPDRGIWRTLVLDADGVPARIEEGR